MSLDLDVVYSFAVDLARKAGAMIKEASETRHSGAGSAETEIKLNSVDLVTETDQRVEKFVIGSIAAAYPDHKFIGEESYAAGERPELTDEPTWIVDPIDGTTNFIHGFPFCCISIGFCVNKVPTIGVVYNPFLDQLYRAQLGQGACLNDKTLPLSRPGPLKTWGSALVGLEYGSLRGADVMRKKMDSFQRVAGDPKEIPGAVMAHSIRSVGSAALNFCMVAAAQMDCYWEIGCYSWDVCAGVVIAREAGGRVYGKNGCDFDAKALTGRHFFVIRKIADEPNGGETGSAAQGRLTKEFHQLVENWDP